MTDRNQVWAGVFAASVAAFAVTGPADAQQRAQPLPISKSAALNAPAKPAASATSKPQTVRKANAGDIRIPPIRRVRPTMPPKPAALRKWLSKL